MKKPLTLANFNVPPLCLAATDQVVVVGFLGGDLRILRMDTPLFPDAS
jgi:hypothetical protein